MIRTLIVDDSVVFRKILAKIMSSDPDIDIVGDVCGGHEAIDFIQRQNVDVITMDIHMPGINGFETTRRIMESTPIPIVIISACWRPEDVEDTFKAMDAGAVSIISKPGGFDSMKNKLDYSLELIETIKKASLSEVNVFRQKRYHGGKRDFLNKKEAVEKKIVAIGASTGGPVALRDLLYLLPGNFLLPILVVQHIASGFTQGMVNWLNASTPLDVKLAEDGEKIQSGSVLVAPEGVHLEIVEKGIVSLRKLPSENMARPSVSRLFRSVGKIYGASSVGIILSGMGVDGARELKYLYDAGALTLAQDRESSIVWGMPGEAVRLGAVKHIVSPYDAGAILAGLARKDGNDKDIRGTIY